jgi:hypothetical protein
LLSNKEIYNNFCKDSDRPLIFQTPLWLDAVVGQDNWDVILTFQGNLLSGAMPYVFTSKLGIKQITLPFLTPYLGPIILFPSDLKEQNKLSFKRKITKHLVDQIPKTDRFITQTDFNFDYWLPFYWMGYKQTTRYSYLLDTSQSFDSISKSFKPNIRKHIKRSKELFTIESVDHINNVFDLHEADLKQKGQSLLFSKSQLIHLDTQIKEVSKRMVLHAIDKEGHVIGAFYLVFDHMYTHYLIGAAQAHAKSSGVMSLLMEEAIKEAQVRKLTFNFEGSMHQSIERFFASFGGAPTPYMHISKINHKWLKEFTRFNHTI